MKKYIKELLASQPSDQVITIEGWIRTTRDTKNVCFFELSDGSSLKGLQVIIDKGGKGLTEVIPRLTTGSSARVEGILAASPGGNQRVELKALSIAILGGSPTDLYPLQKKRHSMEYLREIAHLRPRTNTLGAVTRVRSRMSYAIHTFFQERGFKHIHTPIISASDAEGTGELFQVTTLPLEKVPLENGRVDYSEDFFGKPTHLTVSGQLEAEIYALAMKNVYTFGPTFRAENSNTSRHLAEFWMIEPEMAFCSIDGDMDVAEDFLKYVIKDVLESCPEDMEFFNKFIEKGIIDTLNSVIHAEFARVTYTEAVEQLEKSNKKFEFPLKWGSDLQSEHEKYLTEKIYRRPVIVTDYPKDIKAFYMKLNGDGKTVRAMDVLTPRLGEIIGGSQREDDHDRLQGRLRELGLVEKEYWWYLELRRFGSVPHSGFGLGFERLLQYVTGMQNIREVIPFPRTVKSAEF